MPSMSPFLTESFATNECIPDSIKLDEKGWREYSPLVGAPPDETPSESNRGQTPPQAILEIPSSDTDDNNATYILPIVSGDWVYQPGTRFQSVFFIAPPSSPSPVVRNKTVLMVAGLLLPMSLAFAIGGLAVGTPLFISYIFFAVTTASIMACSLEAFGTARTSRGVGKSDRRSLAVGFTVLAVVTFLTAMGLLVFECDPHEQSNL